MEDGYKSMEFRKLTGADLESLIDLYAQLDADMRKADPDKIKAVWNEIERDDKIVYCGAVDKGKVVAACCAVIVPNITSFARPLCLIENVVTDEQYRNRGLGKEVIGMAVRKAKESGCYKVMLQSGIKRTGAHAFYEKIGFDGATKKAFDMRLK